MAEMVSSALLSGLFSVMFERLATQEVLNFLRPKEVINKLLGELKVLLWSADELLDDAEEKLIYNPRVENWHDELKDVVYKAGELTDKIETEALRLKMEGSQSATTSSLTEKLKGLFSTPLSAFDNDVKRELEEILSSLKLLLSQKDALGLGPSGKSNYSGVKTRLSERSTPLVDESDFCGRGEIKKSIIQSLRSAEVGGDKVSVIPVIGAGGLGKTTLVQIIYDHPEVRQLFGEVRAWITVSTEFDLLAITKMITRKVSSSSQVNGDEDQQELLFKLRDALKGKRFLLVLDDVWSEDHDEWESLKSCFMSGMSGSKIIVTTRNRKVASIMAPNQQHHFLPELPKEDCWQLFSKTVFTSDQDRDAHPNLEEIGKKIVEKCKGLPLSVKSVGGILRGDRDPKKWESILRSSVWELLYRNSKNIIPSLWLSYRYLPSHLKRCFAYCSIFPKGLRFGKWFPVRLWMAEGFLKNKAESTMEEVGKQYFDELTSRSLFQRSSGGGDDDKDSFMMHDLVHDLAMYVSGKFCFCLDEAKISHNIARETRYLSSKLTIEDEEKFNGLSKLKHLRSFIGRQLPSTQIEDILKVLEELAMEGGCLRVLYLASNSMMKSLPDTIGNLKHLRYLKICRIGLEKLPDSVGTLYNLQTLRLSNCKNLTRLPSNMGRLINLRHLGTTGSPIEEMPPHMCNLTKLQTLTNFVVGNHGSSIRDLGALHDLNGELCISGLQNVDDVLKGNLEDKENLSQLVLEWEGPTDDSRQADSRKEKTVLDALQPHANLEKLLIFKYGGTSFPDWVGDSLFSKIKTVHLINCKDGLFLPALGRLPSLKELHIQGFHRLETISDEFYGNDSPFKSLEVLHFEDMPEWKRWSVIEVPRLKELKLKGCPKLVGSLPNSNTITILDIHECESLDFPANHLYPSLERLKIVRCWGSIQLLSLEHLPKLNQLVLEEFECLVELTGESPAELKMLSIEKCPKLEFMGNGRYGSLTDLKIKKCETLKSIPLDYFPKLNQFTLERCKNIESFTFGEEPPLVLESLIYLKLEGLQKFVSFPEGGLSAPNLKEFSICSCKNLRSLPQQMHRLLPSLTNLVVSSCGEIEWWPEGGLPSNLVSLQIWRCKKLGAQVMHWDLQTLTPCLKIFWIGGYGEELLDSFPPEGLLPTSLTSFGIGGFRRLKTLNIHAFPHLKDLSLRDCDELQCLPEESLLNSLSFLKIDKCPLLERRYRRKTGEGWHKISHIPQVWINYEEQHRS